MNPTTTSPTLPDTDTALGVSCDTGQARQYHARLVMHEGRRYCALTEEGAIWVVAAAGCLLQPAVGDVALVSVAGMGGYVLSVLERGRPDQAAVVSVQGTLRLQRSEEHTSELQSLMRISYAVFCLKKKKQLKHDKKKTPN